MRLEWFGVARLRATALYSRTIVAWQAEL